MATPMGTSPLALQVRRRGLAASTSSPAARLSLTPRRRCSPETRRQATGVGHRSPPGSPGAGGGAGRVYLFAGGPALPTAPSAVPPGDSPAGYRGSAQFAPVLAGGELC